MVSRTHRSTVIALQLRAMYATQPPKWTPETGGNGLIRLQLSSSPSKIAFSRWMRLGGYHEGG